MIIGKREFGRMLVEKISETSDIVKISRWAYKLYLENVRNVDSDVKDLLLDIGRMEDAKEFEYSMDELLEIARSLE